MKGEKKKLVIVSLWQLMFYLLVTVHTASAGGGFGFQN